MNTTTFNETAMAERFNKASEMSDYDRYQALVASMIKATVHYKVNDYADVDARAISDNLSAINEFMITAKNWVWQLPEDNRIAVELRKLLANAKPITP